MTTTEPIIGEILDPPTHPALPVPVPRAATVRLTILVPPTRGFPRPHNLSERLRRLVAGPPGRHRR